MSLITFENFCKYYGKFCAVNNLNFSIEKGKIVGFVGKNGAGKSTSIRSLLNIISPTSGKITVKRLDSIKNSKEIKQFTSYIPSEPFFYDNITVKQLFEFCNKFYKNNNTSYKDLAKYLELDINKKISDLSLGNKKKVSIIQALLKENEIIIMDEPTNGLDPLMQQKFFDLILKEKQKGVTVFLSSHNLSEVEKYCDEVIIIKNGEIIDTIDMNKHKLEPKQIVSYTTQENTSNTFEFSGNINDLIKDLSKINLATLEIKNKSVEDEFIKYYQED